MPPPTLRGSLRCRQQRRELDDKKTEQRSQPTRKDMFVSSRNSLTLSIQGLLRLYSRYGPPDRSAAHRRPLSRGSNPCGYPHKPLVSYRINRQLSGWILPPLMIRAFGAHCHNRTNAPQQIPSLCGGLGGFSGSYRRGSTETSLDEKPALIGCSLGAKVAADRAIKA